MQMQMIGMAEGKPKPVGAVPALKRPADQAFDTWLERGLHEIFDEVAREPVPDELLKLIRDHKEK